jgi:hypothetical protein
MEEDVETMPRPASSPDPSPCDFSLFGYLNEKLFDEIPNDVI